MNNRNAIIISAPSGAGKTTLVKYLLDALPELEFSVSACSRSMRNGEINGRDYHFIEPGEFRRRIENNEFVEWQEVYHGSYYGTLKSELERIWSNGHIPIFDVDVKGGLNLKNYFGAQALAIFIQPPSLEVLKNRLTNRGTEDPESLLKRINKAEHELSFAPSFDEVVVNNVISESTSAIINLVTRFLSSK